MRTTTALRLLLPGAALRLSLPSGAFRNQGLIQIRFISCLSCLMNVAGLTLTVLCHKAARLTPGAAFTTTQQPRKRLVRFSVRI